MASMEGVDAPVEVIKPPPKLCRVIDKTAKFVGKHGPQFADRIRQQNASKSAAEQMKFAFLDEGHVYHPYYLQVLGSY